MKSTWNERQLRDYIWHQRESWSEIICPTPEVLLRPALIDVSEVTPEELSWELVRRRLESDLENIRGITLLGKEVRIDSDHGKMFMDLFGIPFELGEPGLAVLELKVAGKTARESFTELLGYAQGLSVRFPAMCRDDLLHVLIAPISEAPAIVRHAVCGSMLFDRRRVVVLEPLLDTPQMDSLRLRPWVPQPNDLGLLTRAAFSQKNFVLEKQVWADDPGYWSENAMNGVAMRSALAMEAKSIHGFTFTATAWPELKMPLPHSLVCVGLNPYEVAHEILMRENGVPAAEIFSASNSSVTMHRFLPNLPHDPLDTNAASIANAADVWDGHVGRIAYETVEQAVKRADGNSVITDRGAFSWDSYLASRSESMQQKTFMLAPTGILREIYDILVDFDYAEFAQKGIHPIHGDDIYLFAEKTRRSHGYFRTFLQRMIESNVWQ